MIDKNTGMNVKARLDSPVRRSAEEGTSPVADYAGRRIFRGKVQKNSPQQIDHTGLARRDKAFAFDHSATSPPGTTLRQLDGPSRLLFWKIPAYESGKTQATPMR